MEPDRNINEKNIAILYTILIVFIVLFAFGILLVR